MQIEITTLKMVKQIVEIDFPYFYRHELDSDNGSVIVYGKMFDDHEITITERIFHNGKKSYEIERDSRSDCYFAEEYKGNEGSFEQARRRAIAFLQSV